MACCFGIGMIFEWSRRPKNNNKKEKTYIVLVWSPYKVYTYDILLLISLIFFNCTPHHIVMLIQFIAQPFPFFIQNRLKHHIAKFHPFNKPYHWSLHNYHIIPTQQIILRDPIMVRKRHNQISQSHHSFWNVILLLYRLGACSQRSLHDNYWHVIFFIALLLFIMAPPIYLTIIKWCKKDWWSDLNMSLSSPP